MSSLAKQLQQLQIPSNLVAPSTKKQTLKASLLFDGKEASNIDNETIFSLATNGLQELILIEPGFASFNESIFSDVSKKLERSVETKEFNDRLDKQIAQFLRYLSPYFLLKPAHKTLEWLIRRFRIHIMNQDALVYCALPYHETNLFARVVQLLEIKNPASKWHWLGPLQNTGSPLSKSTLIQKCATDLNFLHEICEMVPSSLEMECPVSSLRVVFTFYASTVVGALENMQRVGEEVIGKLLPYIIKGLKSGLSEYKCASYMIIAQLCNKCCFEEQLTKSLLDSVCKNLSVDVINEGLMCITIICGTQNKAKLPKKSFRYLMQVDCISEHVCKLATVCDVTALLRVFMPQLVTTVVGQCLPSEDSSCRQDNHVGVLYAMAKELEMEQWLVELIARSLIDEYCKTRAILGEDQQSIKKMNKTLKPVAQYLEKRYPKELESGLEGSLEYIKCSLDDEELVIQYSQWILEFVSLALSSSKSKVVPDSSATLMLSLHHPKGDVRQMAVKHLHNLIETEQVNQDDSDFIKEALLARISDEESIVVDSVLDMEQVLMKYIPGEALVEKLLSLLDLNNWNSQCEKALKMLTSSAVVNLSPAVQGRAVCGLIVLLFLNGQTHKQAIALSRLMSQSSLAQKHYLLKDMKTFVKYKDWKACETSNSSDDLACGNRVLVGWLADNLARLPNNEMLNKIKELSKYCETHPDDLFSLILNCVSGKLITMTTVAKDWDTVETILELLESSLHGVELQDGSHSVSVHVEDEMLSSNDDGLVPVKLLSVFIHHWTKNRIRRTNMAKSAVNLWLFGNFVRHIPGNDSVFKGMWWSIGDESSPESKYTKVLLSVFSVTVYGTNRGKSTVHYSTYRQLMQQLMKCHFSSRDSLLKFLSMIWSNQPFMVHESPARSQLLQHHSLQIADTWLALNKQSIKQLCSDLPSVVISLLMSLTSPVERLRNAAVQCIKTLKTNITVPPPVGTLVGLLAESGEEIKVDHEHLPRMLASAFSCLNHKSSKAKKTSEEKLLEGLLTFITRHIVSQETPTHIQKCLWMVMTGVVTQAMFTSCLPWVERTINKAQVSGLSSDENACLMQAITKFCPLTAGLLESESKSLDVMKQLFNLQAAVCPGHIAPLSGLLDQITPDFFQSIKSMKVQQEVVSLLLDTLIVANNMTLVNKAKKTLIQIPLSADHVVEELCKVTANNETKTPRKKKPRRTTAEDSSVDTPLWQRVTVILEIIQQKDNIIQEHHLVPALFGLLSRCTEVDDSEKINFDYIKQLILSEILAVCQRLDATGKGLPEDQFNVELIVQCIRVSENPQTHHHALLLLAETARLFPEKVLHNVMSIFTFMGANILRQDDSYSFQVISKTVETVIPALIQAGKKQQLPKFNGKGSPSLSLDDIVAMVIRVFVDASPHIPEHRRLSVFSHLVSTVGCMKYLHVTVALLLEHYIIHSSDQHDNEEGSVHAPLDEEFCLALCQEFDPTVQAEGMLNLLKYVAQLPAEKPEVPHRPRASRRSTALFNTQSPLFDVQAHSSKHLRQFKFVSICFIPTVLSAETFVSQVQELANLQGTMETIYLSLIEELLTFVTVTAQHTEAHSQSTTGKFWRVFLHKIYDIIDKVNELLPPNVFITVMCRLLTNSNATVRRKSMDLLNNKLGHNKALFGQVEELVKLVSVLLSLVRSEVGHETPINRQTALYSLKLLARILSEHQPAVFTKVLKACIKVMTNSKENSQVLSNAILCVGEVCSGLKANAIPYLPQFMPNIISILDNTADDRNVVLLLCAVVTLHKVAQSLPNFLSPYLVQIIHKITSPSLNDIESKNDEQEKDSTIQQLHDRLSAFRKDIAHLVTPRVLIPAVSQCYHDVIDHSHVAIPMLIQVLHESVTCMTKHDVTTYSEQIFKFMFVALDFRVTQPQCEPELQDQVESDVINSFCELVMKMSEATFRPVFLKLYERATRQGGNKDRLVVFYRLCDRIADKLKGLMALFAGYIIKNCSSLLDRNNSTNNSEPFYIKTSSDGKTIADNEKSCLLVVYVLDCLQKCLCYAAHGFVDKERFSCLMQPIIDQLENQMGNNEEFQDRVSNHVVPCLAQLAVAAGNDSDWKTLNYQILLKTRHSSSQVRFAALKALEELYRQLGEEFIVILLPESIPFLAELMEDECVEVEQQCQHVVKQIETIIGEPIQKYFES